MNRKYQHGWKVYCCQCCRCCIAILYVFPIHPPCQNTRLLACPVRVGMGEKEKKRRRKNKGKKKKIMSVEEICFSIVPTLHLLTSIPFFPSTKKVTHFFTPSINHFPYHNHDSREPSVAVISLCRHLKVHSSPCTYSVPIKGEPRDNALLQLNLN